MDHLNFFLSFQIPKKLTRPSVITSHLDNPRLSRNQIRGQAHAKRPKIQKYTVTS